MKMTSGDLATMLNGNLSGDPHMVIYGPSKLEEGSVGTVSFLSNPKYEPLVYTTKASMIIVNKDFEPAQPLDPALLRVDNVYQSLGILLSAFGQAEEVPFEISNLAFVEPDVQTGSGIRIGHFTVIKSGTKIGDHSSIGDQVYIGRNVTIGKHCVIYPGVKIYDNTVLRNNIIIHANAVIGSDGFGFAPKEDGSYVKIPQIGDVVIEDDVEVGANTVIDRATMGSTIIKRGVKLDNLIQIAHNVVIGEDTVIAAQTGIAGSTQIGKKCMIGGQVGFVGHIKIADSVVIQAKSGISANVEEPGKKLYGYPALEYQNYLRSYAYFKRFNEIVDRMRELEKEVDKLKQNKS